ncbi:hypothetical protein KCTCHS21_17210 [Cohnella abietis]|uniref:Uncharacterized protein n=1 Tax=Cohnella abietis TaxID=2507935 RepID=A0A3T1D2J1_9BACL|nr:hypothetical protein KCTCHS21_17210 [Cohnella abietis]
MSTIDLSTPAGADIPIEERHPDEVTTGFDKRTAPEGVAVYSVNYCERSGGHEAALARIQMAS